jgi:hypothetical protein
VSNLYIDGTIASKPDTLIIVRASSRGRFEARQNGQSTCGLATPFCDAAVHVSLINELVEDAGYRVVALGGSYCLVRRP